MTRFASMPSVTDANRFGALPEDNIDDSSSVASEETVGPQSIVIGSNDEDKNATDKQSIPGTDDGSAYTDASHGSNETIVPTPDPGAITRLTDRTLAAHASSTLPTLPTPTASNTNSICTDDNWISARDYNLSRNTRAPLRYNYQDTASDLSWDTRSAITTPRTPYTPRTTPSLPPRTTTPHPYFTIDDFPIQTTTHLLPHAEIPLHVLPQLLHLANLHLTLHPPSPPPSPALPFPYPPKHCLLIHNIPRQNPLSDLIHSIHAPGGIRFLQFIPSTRTALLVFFSALAAQQYHDYVARNGFFLSMRSNMHDVPRRGETKLGLHIGSSGPQDQHTEVKKVWVLKRHAPQIVVTKLAEPYPGFCEGDTGVLGETTRSLRIRREWLEVREEMRGCEPPQGEWAVEHTGYFRGREGGEVTLMRFFNVRDAMALKRFLELRGGWELGFAKDICDKECEALQWGELRKWGDDAEEVGGGGGQGMEGMGGTAGSVSDLIDLSSEAGY